MWMIRWKGLKLCRPIEILGFNSLRICLRIKEDRIYSMKYFVSNTRKCLKGYLVISLNGSSMIIQQELLVGKL